MSDDDENMKRIRISIDHGLHLPDWILLFFLVAFIMGKCS